MRSISIRFFYLFTWGIISLCSILISVMPVAAHGAGRTGTSGINVIIGVVFVSFISVLVGIATIFTKYRYKMPYNWVSNSLVGVLLITIGATAARSIVVDQVIVGFVGIIIGTGIGVVTTSKRNCSLCAEATVGAITVHRIAEGLVIVGLSTSGATISVLGILILSWHTAAESVAIGLSPSLEKRQAIKSIIIINVVFVVATITGASGLVTASIIPTDWIVAITAGLLVSLGFSEFQSGVSKQLQTIPG